MAIELISELTQKNNQKFPLLDSNKIRGGIYQTAKLTEMNSIPDDSRKVGMLCYVKEVDKYFKLNSENTWEEASFSGVSSIPVLDQAMLDSMEIKPPKYITIPNVEKDLTSSPISNVIEPNGTYVDILFSAIRKLQSEVARLKNAFQYGINSYNDTNTAMSTVVKGISDPDDEPLWCIEEEDLSQIYSMEINQNHDLVPTKNVNVSKEGILAISNATWTYDKGDIEDPKLFLYLTTTDLDINIQLSPNYQFNLKDLNLAKLDSYNIMICINRVKDNNFIYISIGNAQRSQIIKEGYLNKVNQIQTELYKVDEFYSFDQITFSNLNLSKLNVYSKYQDFSKQVIPSAPTDQDYKYKVAHITVRSVKTQEVLKSIQNQLPNNELIFVEQGTKLWIKNNDKLYSLSSGGGIIDTGGMDEAGLIEKLKEMGIVRDDEKGLQINDISDLTFIHQDTGAKFKFTVDSSGELKSQQLASANELLSSRTQGVELKDNIRGFIGQLRLAENNITNIAIDAAINADRVKIGAFYAPLKDDQIHGCNRAFVELENTSDSDFYLEGCYLHFTCPDSTNQQIVYHLPLTGCLRAGSTYLVVGKKYAEDANVYIHVDTFDQEWFVNGELIDFTIDPTKCYGLALTYGKPELQATDYLFKDSDSNSLTPLGLASKQSSCPFIFDSSFIDALYINKSVVNSSNKGYWANSAVAIKSNTMYKNMFELDPAKQAFQACTKIDSSRTRWQSTNDYWVMNLNNPIIRYPHSSNTYELTKFSPKASFEHKNVSTDKSKLDINKPNMVSCSFGVNLHTTRCFNWISVGNYNEYIWLRKKGNSDWVRFESYKDTTESSTSSYPYRKNYSEDLINSTYKRIIGHFPGDGTAYTAHKCVVVLKESAPTIPEQWEYIVGRANGSVPDNEHCSEIQYFTLYPESYKPVIYQITDQQGFHWIEYQVWAAAANKIYEKIKQDQSANIIPILINTGDMTQNGTRINEWYDYYEAGKILFKEYEQMNVVGNNDLCGTNINILGTGDDQGKSNSFYFHVFYCYDIDETVFKPIINNKYIPSLYYFESKDYRFIMINSEITMVNSREWYGLVDGETTINIYTGFTIGTDKYNNTFTPIYTMVYNMLNTTKKCVVACHEMPFTVITNDSITSSQASVSRSLNKSNALVGSHTNQISNTDTGKGIYWLSRLLEFKGVKLCIGGHKHTYACTYPVREYFYFGGNKNSKDNFADYTMTSTLENDNVIWKQQDKDLTKFPLTKRTDVGEATTGFYPYTPVPDLEGGVVYFMCQATGYKLTSNKELPSANQKFSMVIPQTTITGGADKADNNQKYPMFGIISLDSDKYTLKLVRIVNIFKSYKFNQLEYSTDPMTLQYFIQNDSNNYGSWSSTETIMYEIK